LKNQQHFVFAEGEGRRKFRAERVDGAEDVGAFRPISRPTERALSVLAVGDATAAAAHEEGFADVRSAGGDAAALVALAKQALDPRGGKVLHISGMQVATDIAAALAEAGYTTERHIAYDAVATSALPPALHEPIDIVLFHSARAASAYLALGAPLAGRIAACLSPAVAEAARGGWTRVVVSPAPRADALLGAALGGYDSSGGATA
jgi:uroporphyrinogen-III synthase